MTVALPAIGADLQLGQVSVTWAVTAYAQCLGGLILLGGRLANVRAGRGRPFTPVEWSVREPLAP